LSCNLEGDGQVQADSTYEMILAVWLIVKGFNPSAIASGSAKTETNELSSAV